MPRFGYQLVNDREAAKRGRFQTGCENVPRQIGELSIADGKGGRSHANFKLLLRLLRFEISTLSSSSVL